ncbi:methyltransferase domain-containing protein [uncultured Marinobacter sp.]|uniref:methyltransferase domain-containing protein n=1 Tax=uncultured Marinobacter sp. TaxID=187379 RepID=UPI0030DA40D5
MAAMFTQASSLHEERLNKVAALIHHTGARRVLDLGCGSGSLIRLLLGNTRFTEICGLEQSGLSLRQAREMLAEVAPDDTRVTLRQGSYMDAALDLSGYDAAAMVETIEHIDPGRLSEVQRAVFQHYRPAWLIVTTPNVEYNPLYDLRPGQLRDPDHKFEWPRHKFRQWATTVARQTGYSVNFGGIGEEDPEYGPPTQTAVFRL